LYVNKLLNNGEINDFKERAMRKQFIILVVTGVLLILGWTIVEYMLQSQIQYHYQQLSTYPVMVYSWDEKLMTDLQTEMKQYTFVKEVVYKTSEQSAGEMIQKYGLSGVEEILQQKSLPNILIVYIKGNAQARMNKLILKDKLEKSPDKDRMMTEFQNDIWDNTYARIEQFNQIRWIVMGFIGLVIMLVFLLKRMHYEHHLARIKHLIQTKQASDTRVHDHFWINSILLTLVPVGFSFILYEVLFYNDWLLYSIDWYFFLIELGVVTVATLIAYPFVLKYKHEEPMPKEEL
jgi:cell division protein FtsX